jgi:hypothetical protein
MPVIPVHYNYKDKPYSKWKHQTAKYSGAMLGWIGNNLPGAYSGYYLGDKYYKKSLSGHYHSSAYPRKYYGSVAHRAKEVVKDDKGKVVYKKGQVMHRDKRWLKKKTRFNQDVYK